ncbi:hypothetical protein BGZ93_002071 [Podila epicladia]|nr:hypothetical protein BGZ92_011883 [Podila epicladia]KAG0083034.1 hypothetical protein BGZ93_002071 [Podila epicladia]
MVAIPSRAFWLTLLAVALATTAAAPVESPNVVPAAPVESPNVAPAAEPSDYAPPAAYMPNDKPKVKVCIVKCHRHFANAFPSCAGRLTPEDSPKSLCHVLGYICSYACNYKY